MKLLCLLALAEALALANFGPVTPLDVVQLVFTSLASDRDDDRLAEQLDNLVMAQQLSPRVVTYFKTLGLGPRSLASLQSLHDRFASLPLPAEPPITIQPLPEVAEQSAMIQRAALYAQSYVGSLPNFICDQVTRRYTNLSSSFPDSAPHFTKRLYQSDTMRWNLRFVNGIEEGNVLNAGKKRLRKSVIKAGQSLSRGEFGEDLVMIFTSMAEARFTWHHWEMFKSKRTAVFTYSIGLSHSRYRISWQSNDFTSGQTNGIARAAISGLVYIDPETGVISRLTIQAHDLPNSCPIRESRTLIDYGPVKIADKSYTLPLTASVFITADPQLTWNQIAFTNYRKFEAQSSLTFSNSKITYGDPPKH